MNNEDNNRIRLIEKTSILKADSNVLFLQRKSEKISSAIYLITNFFNIDEPLKWAMREDAVSLIKDMNALSRASLADKESRVRAAASHIGQITSLIELARTAGFISRMNADIMISELSLLLSRLEEKVSHELSVNTLPLDRAFFETKVPETQPHQSHHSYHAPAQHQASPHAQPKQAENKVVADDKGHYKGHVKSNVLYPQIHAKSNRQESILKALGKEEYMNIKDLLKHVKGCSEKTLQRELTTLLQKGTIKRTGERRWSTYSLARA